MEKQSVELIVGSLNDQGVKYLIAGGLAVVAHGYLRFTADVDIMLAMDSHNLSKGVAALKGLNYQPHAPVPFEQFIDADRRAQWIDQKGMVVFSLFSPDHPATEIDLFVDLPIAFDEAYARAMRMEVGPGVIATFCSIEDLIDLKTKSGRPQDLEDAAKLRRLKENKQ
jgi:predicted nucleotidyltransferase